MNTLIHWCVFFVLHHGLGWEQAWSNLAAFMLAVTFSFFANAMYTFEAKATSLRYWLFVVFMGLVSLAIGAGADALNLPSLLTLVVFSALSLVIGFCYSRWVVFRRVE